MNSARRWSTSVWARVGCTRNRPFSGRGKAWPTLRVRLGLSCVGAYGAGADGVQPRWSSTPWSSTRWRSCVGAWCVLAVSVRVVPLTVAVAGLLVLAVSVAGARRDPIPDVERRVFHAVNGLPDWCYLVVWVPMQFGNLVVGLVAGLVVAALLGEW